MSVIAQDANIGLIPVYTNVRQLDADGGFWAKEFHGAFLAAVAHTFSKWLTAVTIPSSFDISYLYPYGSHPFLDPNYSSGDLRIRHDSVILSRLAKTKLVADWDVALQNLRVCDRDPKLMKPGVLNCGQCEKCLRTMTALLALGMLDKTRAFAEVDVSEELLLAKAYIKIPPYAESSYQELIAPLIAKGHYDLARGIKRLINRYHNKQRLKRIKKTFKQYSRKFFENNTQKLHKQQSQKGVIKVY